MAGSTTVARDLIQEIHDMDERELAAAFKRWVQLSELVAPRRDAEEVGPDRTGR